MSAPSQSAKASTAPAAPKMDEKVVDKLAEATAVNSKEDDTLEEGLLDYELKMPWPASIVLYKGNTQQLKFFGYVFSPGEMHVVESKVAAKLIRNFASEFEDFTDRVKIALYKADIQVEDEE